MDMNFKQWLETATSTGDIAIFARPMMGPVRRYWPWTDEDPFFKRKKRVKEHYQDREKIFDYEYEDAPEFQRDMKAQQEKDAAILRDLVKRYNEYNPGRVMSVSQAGEGWHRENMDYYALYIGSEEITRGDLSEIIKRVQTILHEEGID